MSTLSESESNYYSRSGKITKGIIMYKVVTILLTVSCIQIFAEVQFEELKPFTYSESGEVIKSDLEISTFAGEAFADWDSDGDLDMIQIESNAGSIKYFENIGNTKRYDYSGEVIVFTINDGVPIDIPKKA